MKQLIFLFIALTISLSSCYDSSMPFSYSSDGEVKEYYFTPENEQYLLDHYDAYYQSSVPLTYISDDGDIVNIEVSLYNREKKESLEFSWFSDDRDVDYKYEEVNIELRRPGTNPRNAQFEYSIKTTNIKGRIKNRIKIHLASKLHEEGSGRYDKYNLQDEVIKEEKIIGGVQYDEVYVIKQRHFYITFLHDLNIDVLYFDAIHGLVGLEDSATGKVYALKE